MATELARRAGTALIWRGLAMGAEKIIFLARMIILARLLVPEDFGLVAIGMVALAMASTLTDFGVVAALIQQPSRDKRHLDTAWTISVLRGAAITLALFALAPWIAAGFGEARATDIIRALALTALLQAAASIEVARLNREFRFRELAGIRLSAALVNTLVAVFLASRLGPWALVWGAIAGAFAHMATSFMAAPYRPGLRFSGQATAGIARFGRWIFLIGVLSVASDATLRWIIATRLGVAELGLFFLAARLAFLPGQVVSEQVSAVAFPLYAELQANQAKAAEAFRRLLIAVAALLVPICLVFAALVPEMVTRLLGERWLGAETVMQLLILSSIVGLLGDGVTPVLKGTGRPHGIVVMEILQLVLFVVLGWLLTGRYGLAGAGMAWLAAIAASQGLAAWYARQLFGQPFRGIAAPLLAIGATAVMSAVAATIVTALLPGLLGLLAAGLAGATGAMIVMRCLDLYFRLGILQTIAGPFPWLQRLLGTDGRQDNRETDT